MHKFPVYRYTVSRAAQAGLDHKISVFLLQEKAVCLEIVLAVHNKWNGLFVLWRVFTLNKHQFGACVWQELWEWPRISLPFILWCLRSQRVLSQLLSLKLGSAVINQQPFPASWHWVCSWPATPQCVIAWAFMSAVKCDPKWLQLYGSECAKSWVGGWEGGDVVRIRTHTLGVPWFVVQ